jgi:pimeloyl-ACP methyl ester carboxylesterase
MHIIFVHGMGGSAASWMSLTPLLDERGFSYRVADNASQSLDDDVAAVRDLIDAAAEPVVLVGHSYGGAVITNAGNHPAVQGLIYVAAFAPTEGESVREIVESNPSAPVSSFMTRGSDGEWISDDGPEARAALSWDIPDEIWERRFTDRRPSADAIFTMKTGTPAWRSKASWYLVATEDRHILPDVQRAMAARAGATVREVSTSHAIPHAAPARIIEVINEALSVVGS